MFRKPNIFGFDVKFTYIFLYSGD